MRQHPVIESAPAGANSTEAVMTRAYIAATPPASRSVPEEDNMPDGQPVAVAIAGDDADAVFRSLYAAHGPALLRLATVLTRGDRRRAEDLVQETMLRAWTHRGNLDIQQYSIRAWLVTVVRRLAVDAYRARRARPLETRLDDELAVAAGQRADAGIDAVSLRAAVAALPSPQRRVLTEIYYRDRSAAETARILRIPLGTVRSRTFYGLRALRRVLAAHDALV
jgi:RNA polymerase sigma-70 factor (ECF subfamily)